MNVALHILLALVALGEPQPEKVEDLAIDSVLSRMEAEMSPAERRTFDEAVARSAFAEMQSAAGRCGTSLTHSSEPEFKDRTFWTAKGATPEQIVCVQRAYPFVKADPN